ncbi:putative membrane protein DUF2157 [Prauserella shujinwangii]|uniref:Putative membrane protein DUF2157 n=1 Tax=Prauserella shujinwangii TaxID=1453103 RepID=A0A2T0LR53_9PSEU|nr:putative membrane protein DUF2157 [Prauserella shujinwangii]
MTRRPTRAQALDDLVRRGVLSAEQARVVRAELRLGTPGTPRAGGPPWAEIAGYLGGGLVLTGVVVLVSASWDRLPDTARAGLVGRRRPGQPSASRWARTGRENAPPLWASQFTDHVITPRIPGNGSAGT